ncbi:MAG: DUF3999 family protein, partial [Acidobacteriota bacterium]
MKRLFPALLLILAAAAAPLRAETVPTDFAYGLSLPVDGEVPLYEVSLPVEVYRKTVRTGLGDLCVFNGLNEPVPFAVQPQAKKTSEWSVAAKVPFFPLPEEQG